MKHVGLFAIALAGCTTTAAAQAEIKSEKIEYRDGDALLEGELFWDSTRAGRRPGVMVVHEWKGLGDYARLRARMLAGQGYAAFAIDMYGKGVFAKDHEEAGKLSGVFFKDRALMRRRAKTAYDVFVKDARVDGSKVAAMGYCFGGTTVLEMARQGLDLKLVASFHGNLTAPEPAAQGAIKGLVAVFHGADDTWVGDPEAFKKEIGDAGADLNFHSYAGAVHSFTVKEAGDDPSKGMAYNEKADTDSWGKLSKYLKETLK